jgi:putative transposase
MSITEQYNPSKSAILENINGTLKDKYGLNNGIKNTIIAPKITKQAVSVYNNLRTPFYFVLSKIIEVHLNPNIKYKSYRRYNINLTELLI